jgi:hypothetical protein
MSDKYNSKIAAFLGHLNKAPYGYAITVSKDTTWYSVPEGMVGQVWRTHEDCHKRQYQTVRWFRIKYIWELITKGYWNNKYEVEARKL